MQPSLPALLRSCSVDGGVRHGKHARQQLHLQGTARPCTLCCMCSCVQQLSRPWTTCSTASYPPKLLSQRSAHTPGSPTGRCAPTCMLCQHLTHTPGPPTGGCPPTCTPCVRPWTDRMPGVRLGCPAPGAAACPLTVAESKKAASFSASSVADEMTMRRSARRRCTFLSRPRRTSVARLRSCASSTMTTLQQCSSLREWVTLIQHNQYGSVQPLIACLLTDRGDVKSQSLWPGRACEPQSSRPCCSKTVSMVKWARLTHKNV